MARKPFTPDIALGSHFGLMVYVDPFWCNAHNRQMASISPEKVQALRENPLFSGLSDEQFAFMQKDISVRQLEQGEHLFEAGTQAKVFYFLHSGQIKLYRLSPTGQEKVIEIVRPGQTFAEAASEDKNRLSHRGRAMHQMAAYLQQCHDSAETA